MAVLVALCGLVSALLVFAGSSDAVSSWVIRRLRRGRLLLRGFSAAAMLIVFATVGHFLWFQDNVWTSAAVLMLFSLMLLAMALADDLLRRGRRPAVKRRSYLVIATHPGDLVSRCSGTVAGLHDAGHVVHVLVLSDDHLPTAVLTQKAQTWGNFLGCATLTLGNLPAGQIPEHSYAAEDLLRTQIERRNPDVIIAPTHRDTDPGRAAVGAAVLQASDPGHSLTTFDSATAVGFRPDHTRDISDYVDVKAHALRVLLRNPGPVAPTEQFRIVCTSGHGLL